MSAQADMQGKKSRPHPLAVQHAPSTVRHFRCMDGARLVVATHAPLLTFKGAEHCCLSCKCHTAWRKEKEKRNDGKEEKARGWRRAAQFLSLLHPLCENAPPLGWMVRMISKLTASITAMTLVLAACKPAATAPAHDIPAAMRQTATTLLQSKFLHATSIAVVYRGKEFILHQGELETGKGNPPNDATLYEIGSISKTFAGLLLANAVLDGKAALDDPIQSTCRPPIRTCSRRDSQFACAI